MSLAQDVRFSIGGKADRDKQREFDGTLGGVDYAHGNGGCGDGVGVGHEQLIHMPPSSDGTLTRKSATTAATGMLFRPRECTIFFCLICVAICSREGVEND